MTRFLCTGDLHIGAGTDHRLDALADQERLLMQIIYVARNEDVDTILIAGDVFHRPKPTPAELHVFARFTTALAEAGIPAIAVLGNAGHDQYGTDQPTALELFASPWLRVSRNPELVKAAGDVAVCTLPSVQVSRLVAAQDGGDRSQVNQAAADLLIETARGLRSDVPDGWPSVLLGHWSVTGASLPNGLPTDDLHEPVLPLGALEELRFDAVVLGHIHRAQLLGPEDQAMPIFYVGSPGVQNFGEASFDHGVFILDTEYQPNHVSDIRFEQLTDRRFVTVDVDLTQMQIDGDREPLADAQCCGNVLGTGECCAAMYGTDRLIPGDPVWPIDEMDVLASELGSKMAIDGAVVRIKYRATEAQHRRVDQAALRRLALDAGAHKVYSIVPEIIRESRARAAHVDETLDPAEAVTAWLQANEITDGEPLHELTRELLGTGS